MKLSYNWLSQYVRHGLTPEELAAALTLSGLEVEDVDVRGGAMEGVVVGEVLETRPHPNADRLTLCRVDLGAGEPAHIVCGAPNVAAGQKVAVAKVGTTLELPSKDGGKVPVTLDRRKIRGEVSEGMICAEDELGLGDDHSGIMVLDEGAVVGEPFSDYLARTGIEGQDFVLDVNITPNRPDATSHLGVARDVSALTGQPLRRPEVTLPEPDGEAAGRVRVRIEAPDECPRYAAILIEGVKVGPSPAWLKARLESIGLRPRSNVVDVTNFVLHECGQPLHAFDYDRLAGGEIVVRTAGLGETFTTLDGKERKLPEGTLLICDAEKPVALAGIMGGENSEVGDETVNVLLESAYFDPSTIRRAAKALGMQTDASYRFERGVDAEGQVWAAARAAALIAGLGGGRIVPGVVDVVAKPHEPREVVLRLDRLTALLGVEVPVDEVTRLLETIGFEVEPHKPLDDFAEQVMEGRGLGLATETSSLRCVVPSFRPDVTREVDVIEEVARLYGFDRIPSPAQVSIPALPPAPEPVQTLRRKLRHALAGRGLRELYTNSMLSRDEAAAFLMVHPAYGDPNGKVVETLNPISQEMAALRPSLLPGALAVTGYNQNRGQRGLQLFEVGHVFRTSRCAEDIVSGYGEHESLLILLTGEVTPASWDAPAKKADFFDLKGVVEGLLSTLRLSGVKMTPTMRTTTVGYGLDVFVGEEAVGIVGAVSEAGVKRYDVRGPVFFAELNWSRLSKRAEALLYPRYGAFSRFPEVERDLAFTLPRAQSVGPVLDTIRRAGAPLLLDVAVFDLYEGERIDLTLKSVAFNLLLGADRTLRDNEVEAQIDRVVKAVEAEHGAALRK